MRDRTADLLRAKQALSQLSYSPNFFVRSNKLGRPGQFELPTSPLSGVRSNQLSYRPNVTACRAARYKRLSDTVNCLASSAACGA